MLQMISGSLLLRRKGVSILNFRDLRKCKGLRRLKVDEDIDFMQLRSPKPASREAGEVPSRLLSTVE